MHRQNRRARKPVMDLSQRYDRHVARYAWEGLVRRTGGARPSHMRWRPLLTRILASYTTSTWWSTTHRTCHCA